LTGTLSLARHLAIGDIHGSFVSLTTLVEFVAPDAGDIIVTLGDYVDRGPDSAAVVEYVMELGKSHQLVPLRGNHEIMMLDSREKQSWRHAWLTYGGDATLKSYAQKEGEAGSLDDVPMSHIDFLENRLMPFYECETHFFVHANVDPNIALENQSDANLYWRKYSDPEQHCSGKIMVCGHTPQYTGKPLRNEHSICIDTAACRAGWLTCFDVESGTIWQANEAGETRKFSIEDAERTDS
jgi:serine/threonine protein phosphatase 1